MLFVSKTRLMFQIVVDGRYWLVEFSEPGILGASTFRTTDEKVIAAIKRHRFFKAGRITMEDDGIGSVQEAKPAEEQEALDFKSYSHLKSWLKRTYKDDPDAKNIKTPDDVKKYAQSKGVSYRFVDG